MSLKKATDKELVITIKGISMNLLKNVLNFYIEGFKNMRVGKKLWVIIGIKLFVFFFILKLFFFPNILKIKFDNDKDRANFIIENITK